MLEEELQLAELIASNFGNYAWARPYLEEIRDRRTPRKRSLALLHSFSHYGLKHRTHKPHRYVSVYSMALCFVFAQDIIYVSSQVSAKFFGEVTPIVSYLPVGSPESQLYKIRVVGRRDCRSLTVNEIIWVQAHGFREPLELCN